MWTRRNDDPAFSSYAPLSPSFPGGREDGLLAEDDDEEMGGGGGGAGSVGVGGGRGSYQPESLYAHAVVLELVRELQPDVLLGWAPLAAAVASAGRAELEAVTAQRGAAGSGGGGAWAVPGEERQRRALRELVGRAEAVAVFQVSFLFVGYMTLLLLVCNSDSLPEL